MSRPTLYAAAVMLADVLTVLRAIAKGDGEETEAEDRAVLRALVRTIRHVANLIENEISR